MLVAMTTMVLITTMTAMHLHTLSRRLSRHRHLHLGAACAGHRSHLLLVVLVHQGHVTLVHGHLGVHLGHKHLLGHKRSWLLSLHPLLLLVVVSFVLLTTLVTHRVSIL